MASRADRRRRDGGKGCPHRAEGDRQKALRILEQTGKAQATKKAGRATENGQVVSYIHHDGRIGVLVELDCETDFTAGSDQFKELGEISPCNRVHPPKYTSDSDMPEDEKDELKATILEDVKKNNAGKPENVIEKIKERHICEVERGQRSLRSAVHPRSRQVH